MPRWAVNTSILLGSTLGSLLLGLLLLKGIERALGAHHTSDYLVDPRPRLWRPDPTLGFANARHLDLRAFGDVVGRTNAQGFRADREYAAERHGGSLRVLGIGDSVTWGTRVDEDESFLGVLRTRLQAEDPGAEVINAGVVGYSTWQEALFLEKYGLPLRPDVVLVNFCSNDWLPSEDPFGNARRLQIHWLLALLDDPEAGLTRADRELLQGLAVAPWNALRHHLPDPRGREIARRVLIDRPALHMARLARRHGARLVYLLIPDPFPTAPQRATFAGFRAMLARHGIESIDFSASLVEDEAAWRRDVGFEETRLHAWLEWSRLPGLLAFLGLDALDPRTSLARIGRVKDLRRLQEARLYIDRVGHPTARGHRIIAAAILARLAQAPPAVREAG